jgi:hypothetical protein
MVFEYFRSILSEPLVCNLGGCPSGLRFGFWMQANALAAVIIASSRGWAVKGWETGQLA